MVLSMRDTVRYAARLAVYDEHTIKVKSHQLPITIRKATEPTAESPPASRTASSNTSALNQQNQFHYVFLPIWGNS